MPITIQHSQITSIRSKVDGSLGLTIAGPELSNVEKVAIMELQNKNISLQIESQEEPTQELIIKTDMETKTPSQRLRAVLFILYKQNAIPDTAVSFETFYNAKMEQFIEAVKRRFDQVDQE